MTGRCAVASIPFGSQAFLRQQLRAESRPWRELCAPGTPGRFRCGQGCTSATGFHCSTSQNTAPSGALAIASDAAESPTTGAVQQTKGMVDERKRDQQDGAGGQDGGRSTGRGIRGVSGRVRRGTRACKPEHELGATVRVGSRRGFDHAATRTGNYRFRPTGNQGPRRQIATYAGQRFSRSITGERLSRGGNARGPATSSARGGWSQVSWADTSTRL